MTIKPVHKLNNLEVQSDLSLDGLQDLFHPPRLSKPEMHLLLKPFFLLDRHADRYKPIEYVYSVIEKGKAITRGWWVEPHSKYGLPGAFDRDVSIVLHEGVTERYLMKNLPVPRVTPIGTMREFAAQMGIAVSGQNISAIKESLKRLQHTLCTCEETFFDNTKKRYVSLSFRLLAGVGFAGEEENGVRHEENFVIFDEAILSNLNSGYVMVVDLESFRRLSTNIGKQLYSHLAYRFFVETQDGTDYWSADYDWLSVHLGVKRLTELWRAKQQLQGAHDELKELGYIADYRWDGWRVIYTPGPVWKAEQLRRKSGRARYASCSSSSAVRSNDVVEDDPLAYLCAKYRILGWAKVTQLAAVRGLSREQLHAETAKRHPGFQA